MSWVGWRRPKAPRGQQRRGYSDRTSERSRHLVGAHVVWEAKRDEKLGLRRPCFFLSRRGRSTPVLVAVRPRAAAAPLALPLQIDGSRLGSSRRQGTNLRGLLRFHGTRHVELDKLPKFHEEIERKKNKRLVEFLSLIHI